MRWHCGQASQAGLLHRRERREENEKVIEPQQGARHLLAEEGSKTLLTDVVKKIRNGEAKE